MQVEFYINPFWLGVITTVVAEFVILIVAVVVSIRKDKKRNKNKNENGK